MASHENGPPDPGGADAPAPGAGEHAARGRTGGRVRRAWAATPGWVRWPAAGLLGLVALLVIGVGVVWATTDLGPTPEVDQSAVLLDASGQELAVLAQEGVRLEVPLEEIAPVAIDALLAAEDRRFYDHTGVDPAGIGRALWNNLTDETTQGGSTITQQLVKNTYLDSDRTITRKVREAVLAVKLERTADKDQILRRYLNTVYFGRGAYGVEAAARAFFDTSAKDLTLEQAALLMGMLRSPEQLDAAERPEAAKARRDDVLDAMASTGAITPSQARAAQRQPVQVVPVDTSPTILRAGVAPHFVEHVRAQLVERFGERALYDQGLVVHTTLDITDQRAAEAAVAKNLEDAPEPQAALVAVDRSGAVRAWVGGRDFEALQVDLVAGAGGSGRQPGSTFKPIALTAHLADGGGAGERYRAPDEIRLDIEGSEPWEVSNAGGQGYGTMTLAQATAKSVNTVYAQLALEVGPERIVDMAERLGVQRPLEPHPSIALGAQEVTPLEMVTAYSTLARSGTRIYPYTISRVEDRSGEVVWEHEVEAEEVVDPAVADTVSAVLEETPRTGTARRAALDRPMAAKTGTTQDNADAWLAGYTPEYTAVVWIGNAEGNEPIPAIRGSEVQGGSIPAQIWHDFMVEAVADAPPTPFPEPDDELLGDPGRSRRSTSEGTDERADRTDDDDGGDEPPADDATTTTTSTPGDEEEGDEGEAPTTTEAPAPTTTQAPATTSPPTTAAPEEPVTEEAAASEG